jgi:hypothetical protein
MYFCATTVARSVNSLLTWEQGDETPYAEDGPRKKQDYDSDFEKCQGAGLDVDAAESRGS